MWGGNFGATSTVRCERRAEEFFALIEDAGGNGREIFDCFEQGSALLEGEVGGRLYFGFPEILVIVNEG